MIKKIAMLLMGAWVLVACDDQGPLERAGEEADEALEDFRAGGETPENQIDDAVDELRQRAEEASEEIEEAAEDLEQ
jgi:hypothetical protein